MTLLNKLFTQRRMDFENFHDLQALTVPTEYCGPSIYIWDFLGKKKERSLLTKDYMGF